MAVREFVLFKTISNHISVPRPNWSVRQKDEFGNFPPHNSPWLVKEEIHVIEKTAYEALKKALRKALAQGLTHYDDCVSLSEDPPDDVDSNCSCGQFEAEMELEKALGEPCP